MDMSQEAVPAGRSPVSMPGGARQSAAAAQSRALVSALGRAVARAIVTACSVADAVDEACSAANAADEMSHFSRA